MVPRPSSWGALAAPTVALALAAALIAGCGGSDDGGDDQSRPAPSASLFPSAKGKSLDQLLNETSGPADLVVAPSTKVLRVGEDRYAFGVFTVDKTPVRDADVALYAAPGPTGGDGPASGPFPAEQIDLTTEPAFRAKTTADDPDAAQIAYVSEVDLDRPGNWAYIAIFREGDQTRAVRVPAVAPVGKYDDVPAAGDKAPVVHTETVNDVGDVSEIDTRIPPDTMHDDDLADVLGRKPVVLLFATPQLCQSRICGPVADVAEQVHRDFGDRAAFIHQEVYVDNDANKGLRPQLLAYRLPSEPWLFVIDRKGTIRNAIEGPFSVAELTRAVQGVAGPS